MRIVIGITIYGALILGGLAYTVWSMMRAGM